MSTSPQAHTLGPPAGTFCWPNASLGPDAPFRHFRTEGATYSMDLALTPRDVAPWADNGTAAQLFKLLEMW